MRGTSISSPLPARRSRSRDALGRVLAHDVTAPIDVPPFDRANVDGFAVRAADTAGASDTAPRRLRLNGEVIVCGHAPALEVAPGTATTIATGGVVPRGADAVVMIEHTELVEDDGAPAIDVRRAAAPGQFVSYAGSDIARGEVVLRRGTRISLARDRHAGGLRHRRGRGGAPAARSRCSRPATSWCAPGGALAPGAGLRQQRRDHRGGGGGSRRRAGCRSARSRTTRPRSSSRCARALATCDMVVLSGGTSKGAGDLSHRIVSKLGAPGILVHGVALKPGKPLCLAVVDGKPLAVLPGFPTSAIFTFHAFVAPVIRARAGLPPEAARTIEADVPVRIASELGRKEFVLVALVAGERRAGRVPDRQGLRRGDELLAGRRIPGDRRARARARCRHAARASR